MELYDAVELIKPALPTAKAHQIWADLGCGEGLFTHAVATLLGQGSTIHAVDKSSQKIAASVNNNAIAFHQLDFSEDVLPFSALDGMLMANSLHFIKDKRNLLSRLRKHLRPRGELLIIEYELDKGNHWIPHPIPYIALEALLTETGYTDIRRVGERESMYGGRKMYACITMKI